MEIRRMNKEDLETVVQLERQIFPDPWSQTSFEYEIFHNPFSLSLVLVQDTEIYGYAVIWKIYEEFHIANFAIRPDQQGKKLGNLFFEKILELREGSAFALLEVRESNQRAIHLYQKFGFRTIMKRVKYYRNGETALVMQKIFAKEIRSKEVTKD
ncbi:MAG: ribosomal-protein-alanine N-acetyltransferase [Caldithrix sp. RBG_13_44_9]|nr:MAG: ribosomal-protein-alanine N-acetyltransferase [Caldithrix sp. RBG_13_44_9]